MRTIFHVDANSAYLSWTAVSLLENGYPIDIREIPAVVAGDPSNRHGIILAKSIPAKSFGIGTGMSLLEARQKCPNLAVYPPNYDLYMCCSNAMFEILSEYSPLIQRYSVDECWMDYSASCSRFGDTITVAYEIKERIKRELGFTINIGISTNKLLAKMGSEQKKPDRIHTMYQHEMKEKMWPLPVSELFMVGRATSQKLNRINIRTIGDLAKADPHHLKAMFKSYGVQIWALANGVDDSPVTINEEILQKGVGNSTTIRYDVTDRREAYITLLSLAEKVGMRLRKLGYLASLVSVSVRSGDFVRYSHQLKLLNAINTTTEIANFACRLFNECWRNEPIRSLGVGVSDFTRDNSYQLSLFDRQDVSKLQKLHETVDLIRKRYGDGSIFRAIYANSDYRPIEGGVRDGDYIMMGGYKQ
jgi:DNA polymerase-4